MNITSRTVHSLEHEGQTYELAHQPCSEPIIKPTADGIKIGYLVQDECHQDSDDIGLAGTFHSLGRRHSNRIDGEQAKAMLEENPLAVPLSYFEHGRCIWSVMGNKPLGTEGDWRWDGVDFAGVWQPSDDSVEEIHRRAAKELGFDIQVEQTAHYRGGLPEDDKPWRLSVQGSRKSSPRVVFDNWKGATSLAMVKALKKHGKVETNRALSRAAYAMAADDCQTYTSWCNGDVYGVVVEEFDKEGKQTDEDACWGYIGSDHAESELKSQME